MGVRCNTIHLYRRSLRKVVARRDLGRGKVAWKNGMKLFELLEICYQDIHCKSLAAADPSPSNPSLLPFLTGWTLSRLRRRRTFVANTPIFTNFQPKYLNNLRVQRLRRKHHGF